jgi:ribonuclease G
VVEISPLGLVEMTRQNVTDGPREVMTRKCPTCGGDGIVYSEASAAIDVERRLRALAAGSRSQAFRVELAAPIASALVGPSASRLIELEALTKRRFFLEGKEGMHLDHFVVLGEGKLEKLAPEAPVTEGGEVQIELVEVDRHDGSAAIGKLDGLDVCVGAAAQLVGKKVKVRIERVLDGVAYATLVRRAAKPTAEPLTAEAEAEKPTRTPRAKKTEEAPAAAVAEAVVEVTTEEPEEPQADEEAVSADVSAPGEAASAKKKTRRGSRGGRGRKKAAPPDAEGAEEAAAEEEPVAEAADIPEDAPAPRRSVTIHVPDEDLDREPAAEDESAAEEPSEDGAATKKKRTRRGTRGGRKRKKTPGASTNGAEAEATAESEPAENGDGAGDWEYVPMSQWLDEIESSH